MKPVLALVASLLFAIPASAHEVRVGDVEIIHASIPQPAASAKSAGGYLAITNHGTEPERLIGIEADIAAKAETHESKVGADGVGTMEHVDSIEIPPGQTVMLEHGGYHIMFMGLKGSLVAGEMHKVTLIFERAGRVEIEFMIDPPMGEAMKGMDHSKMDQGASD